MAGTMTHRDYHLEDGSLCKTLLPDWVASLQGAGDVTATAVCPRGVRYRKRYYKFTDTGRELSFRVLDPGNAMYTDAFGTGIRAPQNGVDTPLTNNAILTGRTGGSEKDI